MVCAFLFLSPPVLSSELYAGQFRFPIVKTAAQIPVTSTVFLAALLGALLVVCIVISFFIVRLRRVNRKLAKSDSEIDKLNSMLEERNRELANREEENGTELLDSEKFSSLLIQSADDGISF